MIERFFDELQRSVASDKATEPTDQQHSEPKAGDQWFLAALPAIRKIVWRRLFSSKQDDAPDIIQKVILQLLTWRKNNPNRIKEMSADEWQSFASKAAFRAVNRNLTSKEDLTDQLDEAFEIAGGDLIVGNTAAETASLGFVFWQGICKLSLRQRRALLLGSESLLVILRQGGIGYQELSEILELSESDLSEIINRLPFKDAQIAHLIADHSNEKNQRIGSLTKSIKKARHEARAKLQKLISE